MTQKQLLRVLSVMIAGGCIASVGVLVACELGTNFGAAASLSLYILWRS